MSSEFEDINLWCKDCHKSFVFTALEQEHYAAEGYKNIPSRCPSCREAKYEKPALKFYEGVCYKCKRPAKVPFEPSDPKTIRCTRCYRQDKG